MQDLSSDIAKYTESIWKNILGLDVQTSETPMKADALDNTLASCVHIMGEWQGTVTLHCPATLARRAASIMFSLKEEETQLPEIQDALGELANMTGGNLKALFPEPCYLSLPTVAVTNFDLRVPGTELMAMVSFRCENKPFTVSVLKKNTTNGNES
jgi:chemotaxis protein CheX